MISNLHAGAWSSQRCWRNLLLLLVLGSGSVSLRPAIASTAIISTLELPPTENVHETAAIAPISQTPAASLKRPDDSTTRLSSSKTPRKNTAAGPNTLMETTGFTPPAASSQVGSPLPVGDASLDQPLIAASTADAIAPLAAAPFSDPVLGASANMDARADVDAPRIGQASESTETASEVPWRFVLEPYVYLPFETSGDITLRNVELPYEYDLGEIVESLTFAFYGRFEAWKGPWAFVFDGYYFNTIESDSEELVTPPSLQGQLPPQVTVDGTTEIAFVKLDFAGAYRFGDGNLSNALQTAETEFDLGPFIFDAIAGLRLYSFSNEIELTSDIGQRVDLRPADTFVEPMLGARARWNFSDHLAAIVAASFSGFGIGTDISIESYAGIDWLFSGNTSLTANYRLTYIDYTEGSSGFNLFQHGPTLGVKFRF